MCNEVQAVLQVGERYLNVKKLDDICLFAIVVCIKKKKNLRSAMDLYTTDISDSSFLKTLIIVHPEVSVKFFLNAHE